MNNNKTIIYPPPSKSISHRALICGALSGGKCKIENLAFNDDISATLSCLSSIGFNFKTDENSCEILPHLKLNENAKLNCNESGSTLRFFIPIVVAFGINSIFTGSERLLQRPIDDYNNIFKNQIIEIKQCPNSISLQGKLKNGKFNVKADLSSQFLSGLLMALPICKGESEIKITSQIQSKPYIDLTLQVMKKFGANVINNDYKSFIIGSNCNYKPTDFTVETDFSNAAFFIAMAMLKGNIKIGGLNTHSLQGDKEFLTIVEKMGAKLNFNNDILDISANNLKAIEVDVSQIPDLAPPIAALMCFCKGKSRIFNASRLRIKESDRLNSICSELLAIGADITEFDDYIEINGSTSLKGGKTNSHNDHRIAMMLAVASLKCENPIELYGHDCVNKSYPNFWLDFEKAGFKDLVKLS